MLMPTVKPLFENVSSKEYYTRASEFRKKALDGCIHIAYPDFEETILFSGGAPATAVHQSKRWLTVGDELVEPAENKALAVNGRMTAYELPRGLLDIFVHKQLHTMVETELGPYLTAGRLIGYLEGDKSTCVLKLEDGNATAYVYINFGKRVGVVYDSAEGRQYDDGAMKAMGRFKEHAYAAIYFTEPSSKYLKSKADTKAQKAGAQWIPKAAVEVVAPAKSPEPVSPFPVEAARPRPQEAQGLGQATAIAKPARTPPPLMSGVKLVVAMSGDRKIGLTHRSRQQALEVFEEGDIAWVDGKTFTLLHLIDPNVNIILPGGREYPVTLKEAPIRPEESRYIILPRKLRSKLSVREGATIEVKACV
ncbi:MAG TPA: hypothetical protein VMC61_03810 [Methanocella sp.]|nr:hypothetical protein [Methanocella sp.]